MTASFRRFFCAVSILLSLTVLLSSCGGAGGYLRSVLQDSVSELALPAEGVHSGADYGKKIAASNNIGLYFNEKTSAVSVYDSAAGKYWTSLPAFESSAAAVLELSGYSGSRRFVLNSQDSSAAFGSFSYEKTENGMLLTYILADSRQTAEKQPEELESGDIYVRVPLHFTVLDGNLSVKTDMSEIFCAGDMIIERIRLLPYFGALNYSGELKNEAQSDENTEENGDFSAELDEYINSIVSDYILLPDGCGGILYTKLDDEKTKKLSCSVYSAQGADTAAAVGAFGVKQGTAAFAAVITQGEENAVISAERDEGREDGANIVYADFFVTQQGQDSDKLLFTPTYSGVISVSYSFLSGENSDYIGMASAVREILIRDGSLPYDAVSEEEAPVNISLIGSAEGTADTLTADFAQVESVLSMLKAKCADNINLLLEGFLSGGLNQKKASAAHFLKICGGEAGLEALCSYAQKQGFSVYAGVNIATAPTGSAARAPDGKKLSENRANVLSPYIGAESFPALLLTTGAIKKNTSAFMNYTKDMGFDGYALLDITARLSADCSSEFYGKSDMSAALSAAASSFSTLKKLMIKGCDFNVIRNASVLTDVPLSTGIGETDAYFAVPFLPAILHSGFIYSGEAANSAPLPRLSALKAVEYGAAPYYKWVFSNASPYYYELTFTEAVEFISRAAAELSDLSAMRITGHSAVETGVYCTEFDDSVLIYVNYNNYSVTVGDISVMPYDYIRLN